MTRWQEHRHPTMPDGWAGFAVDAVHVAAAIVMFNSCPASVADLDFDGDGFVDAIADCDPEDAGIHPGASDVWGDGVDANCDGVDGNDLDGDGYSIENGDCRDYDVSVHPGASENLFDGLDNDCDGWVDCLVGRTCGLGVAPRHDQDGDGWSTDDGDCDDLDPAVGPGLTEICDGVDNDCDCTTVPEGGEADLDQDGFIPCEMPLPPRPGVAPGGVPLLGGSDPDDCDPQETPGQ